MEQSTLIKLFKHLDTLCWNCEISNQEIFEIAKSQYASISSGKTKNKNFVRLIGQSGSGKTTQLLPCAKEYFAKNKLNPITFAVRDFSFCHPKYNELIKKYGISQIREKTNGFALRLLIVCLAHAIENGYDILFEVTLLSPKFENFLCSLLKLNSYKTLYLALAINKKISDAFIQKRKTQAGKEANRIVNKSSSKFFFKSLKRSIKYYSKNQPSDRIIVWNASSLFPIYDGSFRSCPSPFFRSQKQKKLCNSSENNMLSKKIEYVLENT